MAIRKYDETYYPSQKIINASYKKIEQELLHHADIITFKELKELDITTAQIRGLQKFQKLRKISRGIYIKHDELDDRYLELQKKYTHIIFSHETALYLHDLSDVTPSNYTVTVPNNYNAYYLKEKEQMTVKRAVEERYNAGIIEMKSPYGNPIYVYDKEKTICDILANRNNTDIQILSTALKSYFARQDKDLNTLMIYAKLLKVDKILRNYMEVLL